MLLLDRKVFFWTQFSLLLIITTGLVPFWSYFIPVLLGVIVLIANIFTRGYRIDSVVIFFAIFILFFFVRSFYNNLLLSIDFYKDLAALLYNFGMVYYLRNYQISSKGIRNIIVLFYVIIAIFFLSIALGQSSIEVVSLLFRNSSYHFVSWVTLLLFGLCVRSNPSSYQHLALLFFTMSILLGGRTGIYISFCILAFGVIIKTDRKNNDSFIKLMFVALIGLFYSFFLYGYDVFGDAGIRKFGLGPREFVWACYFDYLNFETFVFGFSKNEVSDCVSVFIDRVSLESSWFNLQILTGFGSIILVIFILRHFLSLFSNNKPLFVIVLSLIFRTITGEFVFLGVFDWLFLILIFPTKKSEKYLFKAV